MFSTKSPDHNFESKKAKVASEVLADNPYPENKVTIVGAGIVGALEAYSLHLAAKENDTKLRITMLDKNSTIDETTAVNVAFSLTPDEIMSVVPPAPVLLEKLGILFSQPGGIRVNDVDSVNGSDVQNKFLTELSAYNEDEQGHIKRSAALLKLGKLSMDLWQKIYDDADEELKQILEDSSFQPCREPKSSTRVLHDGYRIDLISGIANAADKAAGMKEDYTKLGYAKCEILSPLEVMELDPYLQDFCEKHSETLSSGEKVWKNDTTAIFRPGGCINAAVFLPKFYDYLARVMGAYVNDDHVLKNCFRLKFNREVTGVVLDNSANGLSMSALKVGVDTIKANKHTYQNSDYVLCPGEAVGTLHKLGFDEPAYTGFAGASLKLNIDIPAHLIESYKAFDHCMEVHGSGVVLAWQARAKNDGKTIEIAVAGTKAFYADQKPDKDQDFAKNRNLLQLNMINDVLPEFISWALHRDTKGEILSAEDLKVLENTGIAVRWVGTRAVTYDGVPSLGSVYLKDKLVLNTRCTTHFGSGGGSFAPAGVYFSQEALKKQTSTEKDAFTQEIMQYSRSNRKATLIT